MSITSEKELSKAIKDGQDTIEIEGDLIGKTIRIKATGKVAWGVVVAAMGAAIATVLLTTRTGPSTASMSLAVNAVAIPGATAILGLPATISALTIAIAGGGIGVLNKLRDYKIVSREDSKLILQKKH